LSTNRANPIGARKKIELEGREVTLALRNWQINQEINSKVNNFKL
jgi:hypothetical protein